MSKSLLEKCVSSEKLSNVVGWDRGGLRRFISTVVQPQMPIVRPSPVPEGYVWVEESLDKTSTM
jgi:hypothetical protein